MYKYQNTILYGLIGYFVGISGDVIVKNLTANKYEKYYNRISYKNSCYGFLSLVGFCYGTYFGYYIKKKIN
tara:strand:- start:192 stop:404 length:213 start_codon:yes stop_codon:yes gene_type:complete